MSNASGLPDIAQAILDYYSPRITVLSAEDFRELCQYEDSGEPLDLWWKFAR